MGKDLSASDDQALVLAWRAGDNDAGEQLFDRYYEAVVRFFRNKTDESSCNDLVQKTFLGCVEGLARLKDTARFRNYLFAIAYRSLCKHYRTRRGERVDYTTATAHDLGPSPTHLLAERDEQRILLHALRRIPIDYQVVLELVYWEKLTAAEVAEVLDIPLGTAKTRIRTGRKRLSAVMAELVDSRELLASTVSGIDGWAAQLRGRLGRS